MGRVTYRPPISTTSPCFEMFSRSVRGSWSRVGGLLSTWRTSADVDLRLLLRGEVIWQKARGSAGSCAWGSFQRPANPVLRDLTERVIIASKGRFDRAVRAPERAHRGLPSNASLSRDEFMEATTDVWEILAESASRVGHPAPFPVELPARLIHLYTYYRDLVLDPFMGSGTTAVPSGRGSGIYRGRARRDKLAPR